MTSQMERLDKHRGQLDTASGPASYVDTGGAAGVVELDGARLFFPDERAAELTAALRRHWDAHP